MRHESNEYNYANIEQFQRDQRDFSIRSDRESVFDSLRSTVQNNGKTLWGIGIASIAAGATLYLLRTERGKDLSSQITSTVTDSLSKVQESVNEVLNRVKDRVTELTNRWNAEVTEIGEVNPATSGDRLRRVI